MTCSNSNSSCVDKQGCPKNRCPDFVIKRHDTRPGFRLAIEDCNGPVDLTGLICEISMWAKAKLKKSIGLTDDFIAFADNIGFEQCKQGDIIVMNRVRAPEQMLVLGFDETNKYVMVQRGYNGTIVNAYKKGSDFRIFRVLNGAGSIEMTKEDVVNIDGTTTPNVIIDSFLVYEWDANDTCLPGCYWFEFKLLKMMDSVGTDPFKAAVTPSFASYTEDEYGCQLGIGVEWNSRYPGKDEGYLIKIVDSPTAENVL